MAYDVFISYSSRDKPIADGVCANLEAAGVRCWIAPRDIQAGRDWPTEISLAIPQCRAMVLVFSTHSNNSNDVSRELVLAASNKLFIIPFKIDDVAPKPGMNYYLASTHWLDAMNPPTREQIQELVGTVRNLLGLESLAPAPFIPILPAPRGKVTLPSGKKILKSRLFWIGIALAVLLVIGLCVGGFYLGKKLLPTLANAQSPTPAHEVTAPAAGLGQAQVTATMALGPAWTATLPPLTPVPGVADITSTSALLPTAATSLNIHADPGKILEVPGNHVAYSPDGKWLILGEGQIHFYDTQSLKEVRSIQANRRVNGIAISPDSKLLAAIDESRGVMLFDMASGSELRTLPRTVLDLGQVTSSYLAFSPDNLTLAVAVMDTVKLFNVADGQETGTLVVKGASAILFSPDGKSLYTYGYEGLSSWDVATRSPLRSFSDMSMTIYCMALSPDGSLLVTGGSFDAPIVVWNAATGQQVRTLAGHKGGITSLVFSPDGKLLASSAGDVTIKLWDVANGNLLQTLTGHTEAPSSLAISPDGSTLVSGSQDGTTRLWTLAAGGIEPTATPAAAASVSQPTGLPLSPQALSPGNAAQVKNLKIIDVDGSYVAWSPDGKWLVIGGDQIHFYDTQSLKEIRSIQANRRVNGITISPDSKVLAAIDESRGVILYDMASGSELRILSRTITSTSAANSSFLAFSPDSQTLAMVVGDTVKLFNVADDAEKGTLVAKGSNSIVFSPDGKSVFAGSWENISKWDVASTAQLLSFGDLTNSANRLAVSPDGKLLISGGTFDEPMVVWDTATGEQVRTLAGHKGGITSLAFSSDGKLLASSAGDVTVKLWDVTTGTLLQTLVGHTEAASSVAISPDGATLASIGYNQGVWLWGVAGK